MNLLDRYDHTTLLSTLGKAAGLLLCALATTLALPAQAQQTYIVDTADDGSDASVGDGTFSTGLFGGCTLRAALQEANSDAAADTIEFGTSFPNGTATITLDGELLGFGNGGLPVEEPVAIDGTTAPGYSSGDGPAVVVDGSNLSGDLLSGDADPVIQFLEGSGGSTVQAIGFENGPKSGVVVGEKGEDLFANLVSLDLEDVLGALLSSSDLTPVPDVTIESSAARGNAGDGMRLISSGSTVAGSVVSGNGVNGVFLIGGGGAGPNEVTGNTVGLNRAKDTENGNSDGNIDFAGVLVADDNAEVKNNTISGNSGYGIMLVGDDNQVIDNNVGTDGGGTAFPNGEAGIYVGIDGDPDLTNYDGSTSNAIAKNVVGGNDENGIEIDVDSEGNVNNEVTGNYVGTNSNWAKLGNGADGATGATSDGIHVEAANTTVGGEGQPGTRGGPNVVGYNDDDGIQVEYSENSSIAKNYVGTNLNGDNLGNGDAGISVADPSIGTTKGNTIEANVVGHNDGAGIEVQKKVNLTNTIVGNYIGTNSSFDDLGNGGDGILIEGDNTTVGQAGTGNVIGYNGRDGIRIAGASGTSVLSNFVGTNPSFNEDLGNGADGIGLMFEEEDTLTEEASVPWDGSRGGAGKGNGNGIAFNDGAGIDAEGDPADNTIRGNRFSDNNVPGAPLDLPESELPIDDPTIEGADVVVGGGSQSLASNQASAGQAKSQNRAEITNVVPNAIPEQEGGNTPYPVTVDFYEADSEGDIERYLGKDMYEVEDYNGNSGGTNAKASCTDPPCPETATLDPDASVSSDDLVTATSTDDSGNTSEFSSQSQELPVEMAGFEASLDGSSVTLTWQTVSETGNAGFEVQRKGPSGDTWASLGFVESKASGGTTTETQSYRFAVEQDLEPGTHRFRLQQRDLDGSTTLSEVAVVEKEMGESLILKAPAPNPARSATTLSFGVKKAAEATVSVYNTLGQRVRTVYEGTPQPGQTQTARLETAALPSGVYFLRLEAGQQATTQRLTIVR